MKQVLSIILLILPFLCLSQDMDQKIEFPDIPGYVTLKCDFHIHTVFSDGSVWPSIRVEEALRDGLDAISLTEHLEYQPHGDDIPHPDRNRSYEIALQEAKAYDLMIVHGAEITRDLPPGHANAIFIEDANKLNISDPLEAYMEAKRQGAFVFWNHPNWIAQQKNGMATLTDMHRKLIEEDMLHGIEVVNDITYSEEALAIALEQGLTIMGTSDIHGLVDWQFELANGGHRPISLVFAEERSIASIKEALEARRVVAWFNQHLIGHEEVLKPLLSASLQFGEATYEGPSSVANVTLTNNSDADLQLRNTGAFGLHKHTDIFIISAHSTKQLQIKTEDQRESFSMEFEVLNATIGPKQHPRLKFDVVVDL